MTEPLRIGVIGATSTIARNAVIPAIAAVEGARVTAVASRSDAAALLSEHHPAMHVHDDYARVLDDPDVDAVYIPLPNHLHAEWTVRAAAAGKHVLCEKPLARSADEARAMATACTDADVVLMEAYMTPYHPRNVAVREWLDSGGLGALRHGFARFTGTVGPDNHRWRPEMGGGALLDLGVYCLEPLLSAAGWGHTGTRATTDTTDIAEMAAHAVVVETGVDATFSGWLRMDSGATLSFVCSFEAPEHQRVELVGVDAAVSIDRAFTTERGVRDFVVAPVSGAPHEHTTDTGDCYEGMVAEFATAIQQGRPVWRGTDRSIAVMEIMDRLAEASTHPSRK